MKKITYLVIGLIILFLSISSLNYIDISSAWMLTVAAFSACLVFILVKDRVNHFKKIIVTAVIFILIGFLLQFLSNSNENLNDLFDSFNNSFTLFALAITFIFLMFDEN